VDTLVAFPVILVAVILQTTIVSRLTLFNGTADVVMLVVVAWSLQDKARNAWIWALFAGVVISFISSVPFLAPLISFVIIYAIARVFHNRVWQSPILGMFVVTFIATIVQNGISFLALQLANIPMSFNEAAGIVTLPSLLLNLLFALPVYLLINDLAHWVYPEENEL
jgi:rod shape-determining protein MreD